MGLIIGAVFPAFSGLFEEHSDVGGAGNGRGSGTASGRRLKTKRDMVGTIVGDGLGKNEAVGGKGLGKREGGLFFVSATDVGGIEALAVVSMGASTKAVSGSLGSLGLDNQLGEDISSMMT